MPECKRTGKPGPSRDDSSARLNASQVAFSATICKVEMPRGEPRGASPRRGPPLPSKGRPTERPSWPSRARNVELDWEMRRKQGKVSVFGQNRHAVPVGDCANHEVGVRALDSTGAAHVEELGGALMVGRLNRQIWELTEVGPEAIELCLLSNPREHLLTNRADEMSSALADELPELQ